MTAIQWADPTIEAYIFQTLCLMFGNVNGKLHILKSELILNYMCKTLTR
jgi:hypothetical protein